MATAARCRGRHFAFSAKTISLLGGSKLKSETWPGYVSDILPGSSLRVCAEPYGVSLKALWFMRMRLLLDEKTRVVCGSQAATGLAGGFFSKAGFWARNSLCRAAQQRCGKVKARRYDARMVVSLTWGAEGVSEGAFVTRAYWRGRATDQFQMHLARSSGPVVFKSEMGIRVVAVGRRHVFFPIKN